MYLFAAYIFGRTWRIVEEPKTRSPSKGENPRTFPALPVQTPFHDVHPFRDGKRLISVEISWSKTEDDFSCGHHTYPFVLHCTETVKYHDL